MEIIVLKQNGNQLTLDTTDNHAVRICIHDNDLGLNVDMTSEQVEDLKRALEICCARAGISPIPKTYKAEHLRGDIAVFTQDIVTTMITYLKENGCPDVHITPLITTILTKGIDFAKKFS
jgi:hypothetical protein